MTARSASKVLPAALIILLAAGCTAAEDDPLGADRTATTSISTSVPGLPGQEGLGASSATEPVPPGGRSAAEVLTDLSQLPIKGRAPKTGYNRALFGDAWTDDVTVDGGRNGCDTRNDVLRRDLVEVVIRPDSSGCAVASGTLHDPYSGTTIPFTRGADTSANVQIDHIVALSDSWQKGAQNWDAVTRRNFANDPRNLQATAGDLNQQKGDGDAATWLPPNKSYRCTYVARIVTVKSMYELWVTQAEHDAIASILSSCVDSDIDMPPSGTSTMTTSPGAEPSMSSDPPGQLPAAHPAPVGTPSVPEDPSTAYYPSCRAARAAGAAPLYVGQPGYRAGLDGDGDGAACEG